MGQDYLKLDANTDRDEIIDKMTEQQLSEAVIVNLQEQYLGLFACMMPFNNVSQQRRMKWS